MARVALHDIQGSVDAPLRVLHLVDAMGSNEHLWGKERVVQLLMREQRASGRVEPRLLTITPCHLERALEAEGFPASHLGTTSSRVPLRAAAALARIIRAQRIDVVHAHGYKANLMSKLVRAVLRPRPRLVCTHHGWVETDVKLRLYNALDRWTSRWCDVTTVPDRAMLCALPRSARTAHVPNGVPDLEQTGPEAEARARFGPGAFVAGTLGRVSEEKGILELLEAARACPDPSVVFAVAGVGGLADRVLSAGENVRYVGYSSRPDAYIAALDVYVQSSRSEGLSLALLEAMRAGKPIVATDVGATRDALDDGRCAILVPSRAPDRILDAILALHRDRELAAALGRNARRRYESDYRMQRQHERFLALYSAKEGIQ